MRLRLRDVYGEPTAAARRLGVVAGLLTVCAFGFAFGRMSAAATPAEVHAPAPVNASAVSVPPASAGGPAPHTQAGSVTAAAEADCILGGPLVLSPSRYQAALSAMLAPDKESAAAILARQESAQFDSQTGAVTAAAGGTRVYIACVPIAYRIESAALNSAAVSVWSEQIVAVEWSFAPSSAYVTETLHMVWTASGWKLESSELLDTQWAPAPLESPLPQAGTLPAQMVNFTPLGGA